jgi:hypothetical protein
MWGATLQDVRRPSPDAIFDSSNRISQSEPLFAVRATVRSPSAQTAGSLLSTRAASSSFQPSYFQSIGPLRWRFPGRRRFCRYCRQKAEYIPRPVRRLAAELCGAEQSHESIGFFKGSIATSERSRDSESSRREAPKIAQSKRSAALGTHFNTGVRPVGVVRIQITN